MPKQPPNYTVTPEIVAAAVETEGSINAAAEKLGIGRATAQRKYKQAGGEAVSGKSSGGIEAAMATIKGDQTLLEGRFTSVDECLAVAKVDLDIWEVEKAIVNGYDVTAKIKNAEGEDELVTRQNKQVKIWLRRKVTPWIESAANFIEKRIDKKAPKREKIKRGKIKDPHLMILGLHDAHLGKLAWSMETGESYDLSIARKVYLHAVRGLLDYAAGFPIEQIVIPIGSDFYHIDNLAGTTANQTQQDYDTRLFKIFTTGEEAIEKAVELCRQVAPVRLLYVPGNHDRMTSWYLCRFLAGIYRNDPEVEVDTTPTSRKYIHYGVNLIGMAHGDQERHAALPTIMADENPEAWAASGAGSREFHVGHLHKKKTTTHQHSDTHGGTVIRILPSLSGTDAWHYRRGYVKGLRAAEAHLYAKEVGHVAGFTKKAPASYYV